MKKLLYFPATGLFFSLLILTANAQWTQKANFGGGNRSHATSFSIGTKGYVSCGYNGVSTYYNDLWEYNPATNAWTQKASLGGVARTWPTGFSVGSKGYVGLGQSTSSVYLNDFWEYDPATNTWVQKANFAGAARIQAVGFAIGTKGYVGVGGAAGATVYNDFWEYNPSTNAWTSKMNFGGPARSAAVGFNIGSKGYIGTGGSDFKNDFWEYDPTANTWVQKANFGGAGRRLAVGFGAGGKGYIGTGQASGNIIKKDFWEYHPATNTWIQKTDVPGPTRANGIGFSIGSKGYVGLGLQTYSSTIPMNDFYEYDPALTPVLIMGSLGATSYCGSTVITVPYSSSGITFNSGNVFTVQLSNASGSFTSPTSIGTLTSTAASGNINATIPNVSGTGYRIRVRSSNPVYTTNDNGSNITITPVPSPPSYIYIVSQACIGGTDWEATFMSSPQMAGITYLWSENGGAYQVGGMEYSFAQYNYPTVTLNVKYQNACGTSAPLSPPPTFNTPCGSFRMSISPNPAKETINLTIEDQEITKFPKVGKTPFKATINLYNENNILIRKIDSDSKRIIINRHGLLPGRYIVQVIIGTEKMSKQIIIE